MPIWQLCANLLIPNCLRFNLSYSPLAALELYVKCYTAKSYIRFMREREIIIKDPVNQSYFMIGLI